MKPTKVETNYSLSKPGQTVCKLSCWWPGGMVTVYGTEVDRHRALEEAWVQMLQFTDSLSSVSLGSNAPQGG